MKFVSLHGHTSFSTGDAHGTPAQHVERVKELGMTALALTEHGNTSSHVQLEQAAHKAGIKPIFGCELYVAPPETKAKFHLTVLAMNENGYRQLNRLVTRSYAEGFHQRPTVHTDWLFDKEETSDLIVLSGCADSWLSCTLLGGKSLGDKRDTVTSEAYSDAVQLCTRFTDCYGDRFYLEVQRFTNYDRTCELNKAVQRLSADLDIPLVATADVHTMKPEEHIVQKTLNAIGWHQQVANIERDYSLDPCAYPLSDREIAADLVKTGLTKRNAAAAVLNTAKVADRCNVTLPKTAPVKIKPAVENADKALVDAVKAGIAYRMSNPAFARRYGENKQEYGARLRKELKVIIGKGFSDYFLINQQIIGWAKDSGIVTGPGRGSAASSLVCYLLRITEVDPMQFPDMVFERFLDPGREDDPDIDTDYQKDRRHEVFSYARSIYGMENVGNIANFSRFRGKTAIKDTAKAYGIHPWIAEDYAELIKDAPFGDPREFDTVEDTAEAFAEAKKILDDNPELKVAFDIEGNMKTLGIHAAGMVISNRPISDTCAIYSRKKTNGEHTEVIAYDKRDAAYLNMLKLDCLGLSTMKIVADIIDMVPELTLEKLYNLELDDDKVLQGFADDDLVGVFQFEGRATRSIVKRIFNGTDKVPTFMTLSDINALSRPGSLSSGMTDKYIAVERGAKAEKIHPVVDEILAGTNGCLVYQEQVMKIGQLYGGLDNTEIGRLRKIIGAKQAGGAFEAFWVKFRDGAKKLHNAPESKSREIWDYMAASASYLFNVAHAISYALVAYWTMYLKVYHPAAFFTACLRHASDQGAQKGGANPMIVMLQDALRHNVTISPPHSKLSGITWKLNKDGTGAIAGFTQIDGVGESTARRMIEIRQIEQIKNFYDFTKHKIRFGVKAADRATAMARSADPFHANLSSSIVTSINDYLFENPDEGLSPATDSVATMFDKDGEYISIIGHVVAVKIIDVIDQECKRNSKTREEVLGEMSNPELDKKAKLICVDKSGSELHINVSRFQYPTLQSEIHELTGDGIYAVYAYGKASNDFGPAVSAMQLTAIECEV